MDFEKLQQSKFQGKARTQFFAHKDFISKALSEGYPAMAIWNSLREDNNFDAKYPQFIKYIARYIRNAHPRPSGKPELPKDFPKRNLTPSSPSQTTPSSEPTGDPSLGDKDKPFMLGGVLMDPKRPKRVHVDTPQSKPWNPIALTDDEIKYGITTDR